MATFIPDDDARTKAVPDGWMLVPVQPTDKMVRAYCGALQEYIEGLPLSVRQRGGGKFGLRINTYSKACARYRAMVAAAPEPPVQP